MTQKSLYDKLRKQLQRRNRTPEKTLKENKKAKVQMKTIMMNKTAEEKLQKSQKERDRLRIKRQNQTSDEKTVENTQDLSIDKP